MKTRKKEKNSSLFNTSAIENFGIEHAEMDITEICVFPLLCICQSQVCYYQI